MPNKSNAGIKSGLRGTHANYFDNFVDSVGLYAEGQSGGEEINLTDDTTLAVNTHSVQVGKFVTISADDKTLTLPAVVVGASFIIVNTASPASSKLTISPNSNDKFLVDIAGAAGTDNKDIILAKATQDQYDYVHLVGLSSNGWLIQDVRGTWVDES
jgi:hypothetical protein|tara:strand:+ start:129 stop:599 length:471 start_codon:yes stop_codon:yes gene_type:complete